MSKPLYWRTRSNPIFNNRTTSLGPSSTDNLLHCAPHPETSHAVFKHASKLVRSTNSKQEEEGAELGGWVSVYGAFKRDDGDFASEGDQKVSAPPRGHHRSIRLIREFVIFSISSMSGLEDCMRRLD